MHRLELSSVQAEIREIAKRMLDDQPMVNLMSQSHDAYALPLIDISLLASDRLQDRIKVVTALDQACKDIGFLTPGLIHRVMIFRIESAKKPYFQKWNKKTAFEKFKSSFFKLIDLWFIKR